MARSTIFDCFCGLGGLSLGGQMAGMEVIGGIDAEPVAVEVFRSIFPDAISLNHDLLVESPAKILKKASIYRGDVDILVGGPPCQPYSINNHQRGLHDARCKLVDSYLGFVGVLKPQWIVMENVPGFATIESGKFLEELVRALRAKGYFSKYSILRANNFGVPQRRRRLILVASRERDLVEAVTLRLNAFCRPQISLKDAIGDLPESTGPHSDYVSDPVCSYQKSMRRGAKNIISNHVASNLGALNLERIRHIPPGGNWRDIPRALLPLGMQRARLSDHTTRYGRLTFDDPAFTLLTKCDPHWGCFLHPSQDRVLTVREAARVQSIPDKVLFPEIVNSSYKLIGNSVPPLLANGILKIIQSVEHSFSVLPENLV